MTVLQFHDVQAKDGGPENVELAIFTELLDRLQEMMVFVPLEEGLERVKTGKLPRAAASLTFDDGYAGWVSNVAPTLLKRGLPATFFVSTGHLGGAPLWHERVARALKRIPLNEPGCVRGLPRELRGVGHLLHDSTLESFIPLAQEICKYLPLARREVVIAQLEDMVGLAMQAASFSPFLADSVLRLSEMGFSIGAHTENHPILSLEDERCVMDELARPRKLLSEIVGKPIRLLAYPNGRPRRDYERRHCQMAQDAGYTSAFTTAAGAVDRACNPMELPRFAPWRSGRLYLRHDLIRNSWRTALDTMKMHNRPRHRVMLVENGAGFGGAVVALNSLLLHTDPAQVHVHLVTNTLLPGVEQYSAVQGVHHHNGRRLNFRAPSRWAAQRLHWPISRLATLSLGVLDEAFNRAPYFLALLVTAIKVQPDLIHGNNGPTSNREALWVARLLRRPYVQHLRGPHSGSNSSLKEMERARVVIPVSQWLTRCLLQDRVNPLKVRHIYDGMRLGARDGNAMSLDIRQTFALKADRPIVAMIGMLVRWKGQAHFVDACKQLLASGVKAQFLVIGSEPAYGDGGYRRELEQAAADLVGSGDLVFTGQIAELPSLMNQFNVVVSASIEPEPLGLVMLEALAAGCEFVGPAHGGALEVVNAVGCGHLYAPRQADDLARSIADALANPTNDTVVRHLVTTVFSEQRCAAETLLAYETARPGGW